MFIMCMYSNCIQSDLYSVSLVSIKYRFYYYVHHSQTKSMENSMFNFFECINFYSVNFPFY